MAKRVKETTTTRPVGEGAVDWSALSLIDLFLLKCACTRPSSLRDRPEDLRLEFNANFRFWRADEDHCVLVGAVEFSARILSDAVAAKSSVDLSTEHMVAYRSPTPLPATLDRVAVVAFGRDQTIHQLWPYWREFVRSTTTQMGLAPPKIPPVFSSESDS